MPVSRAFLYISLESLEKELSRCQIKSHMRHGEIKSPPTKLQADARPEHNAMRPDSGTASDKRSDIQFDAFHLSLDRSECRYPTCVAVNLYRVPIHTCYHFLVFLVLYLKCYRILQILNSSQVHTNAYCLIYMRDAFFGMLYRNNPVVLVVITF